MARSYHYLKVGDTSRKFQDTLTLGGSPVDLTGATVRFRMKSFNGVKSVDQAATIVSAAAGTVEYQPVAGDVDTVAGYKVEWAVTFPDSSVLTVPAGRSPDNDYIYLRILETLA